MEVNRVCSLLCLSLLLCTLSDSCLNGITERLISGKRYRVSDQLFETDTIGSGYTPQQARLEGESWCSKILTPPFDPPWLQVTFGMEVNISIIQTGGYAGYFNDYYVTNFEVHIGNGTEESLHPLTNSDNSTELIVFEHTRTYEVEDTVLPSPVIARVLRIVAVGWTPQDQVCLRLEALGCVPSTAYVEPCLNGTFQRAISGSWYRVQDQSFKADSVDTIYTPEQARLEGLSWCSSASLTASSEPPWLQVTFGMEVNISIIQTGGHNGYFSDYYVTRFEVHIGDGTKESLHPLTISDDSTQPMVFVRTGTHDIENTTLPSVVTAKVLRIVAVGWTPENQVCLRLEALGCLPYPGPPTDPTTTTAPNTSYTTRETKHQGQPRASIVGGAVGGSMSLLVALLLLIVVVIPIFFFIRRRRACVQLSESCEAVPEHRFDNTLYRNGEEVNHLGVPDIPSPNIYESIPATSTILHEPIHDLNGSVHSHDEGMHENPLYNESVVEDFQMEYHLAEPCNPLSNTYESMITATSIFHEPIQDINENVAPHNEEMEDNPHYDKSSEDFMIHPGVSGIPLSLSLKTSVSTPTNTSILHESIEDLDRNVDDEEMVDNPLYDKNNGEGFKIEYHLGRPDNPISYESVPTPSIILHEPLCIQDHNGPVGPDDEEMYNNPLYGKCIT